MQKLFTLLSLFLFFVCGFSQEWVGKMQDPTANFYDIQKSFNDYWLTHDKTEKGKGYKAFKRWEYFTEKRVFPSGNLALISQASKNYTDFLEEYNKQKPSGKVIGGNNLIASATWTPMGPFTAMSSSQKTGRLNFITIDPTNTLNLWVGAPAGGLWKSTNGGVSWTTNTDLLTVIGCSDLAIDPTNTNIMYLATGDGDAGDTRSIGVLKSTDGGNTWNTTGLTNPVNNYFLIRRLLINPSNTQIILAATSSGIYRTTNAGNTWAQISTNNTYDLEFKPGNPNVVYAAGAFFRVSTDGGATFTTITNGIPSTGVNRMAIAVTPADANYVYVLASSSTNSGYQGFYQSVNSGTTFAASANTLNLLGWATAGTDAGGQGWYDLCIAASPLNKDEVVVGGVNVWRTTNAGGNWSLYGHWFGGGGAPFTHADQHDLEYDVNGTLYDVNDGTVYRRNGASWTEISGTMNIAQIYKLGMSSLTSNKWITGHQDNGTNIWNGNSYYATLGGDGMDCFYDRTNDGNVFGEYQNGGMQRSTNGGVNWTGCTAGLTGNGPWVTIWKQDPVFSNVLYCGWQDLFKSTNLAVSWSSLTPLPAGGNVIEFAIAPSNNQVIYVLKSAGIFKTTDGGQTWSNVSSNLPIGSVNPEYVCIDPQDPNNAWVVFSGYLAGNKVFVTTNGGASWLNLSAGLPNLPVNCIVYQPSTFDRVYIGMDVGVYYRDNNSPNWTLYNTNLPNVPISELEISPASPGLLHASTYGRGVWVASTLSPNFPPVTSFSVSAVPQCIATSIVFNDMSSNGPTSWLWSVNPQNGVSITFPFSQNPAFNFAQPGTYTVTLQANNQFGVGNVYTQTVLISGPPAISISAPSQTICPGAAVTYSANGASSYTWTNGGGTNPAATYSPNANTTYTVTGSSAGCVNTKTVSVTIDSFPTLTVSGNTLVCNGETSNLSVSGAVNYTWSNGSSLPSVAVNPTSTTTYSVKGANVFGCESSSFITVNVNPLPTIIVTSNDTLICLNQSVTLHSGGANTYTWLPGNLNGNQVVFAPVANTTYSCTGTDINGCYNTSTKTVSVSLCEAVKQFELNNLFTILPNPAQGKLIINSKYNSNSVVQVNVTDILGRQLLKEELIFNGNNSSNEIDIENFSNGTYFVILNSKENGRVSYKIVKE